MYFPYPDKKNPSLQGVGAYHVAKTSAGVPMADLGAYHVARSSAPVAAAGLGQAPSITSPWFPQMTPWPYIKGPIYTRPVFKEHSKAGNFKAYPIVRMPSLNGLGTTDTDVGTRAASVCGVMKGYPKAYPLCLKHTAAYLQADPASRIRMDLQMEQADKACQGVEPYEKWAECYYGKFTGSASDWYKHPLFIGGAIVGGCAVLGFAIRSMRRTSDY